MELSVLSWNVKHFKAGEGKKPGSVQARKARVQRVVAVIKDSQPDVFALMEVVGHEVYEEMTRALPGYAYSVTEGEQTQEILIGVSMGFTSFCTQRSEFKERIASLRPGVLLTISKDGVHVPILFLHLKSISDPLGFGLRQAMLKKVFKLKKALDDTATRYNNNITTKANFIVVGDFNTMGMKYGNAFEIRGESEVAHTVSLFAKNDMRAPTKTHSNTFSAGSGSRYGPSNLDHVFAAEHLAFKPTNGSDAEVEVGGWVLKDTEEDQDRWIRDYSDHAPITFTVRVQEP